MRWALTPALLLLFLAPDCGSAKTVVIARTPFSIDVPDVWLVSSAPDKQVNGGLLFAADANTHDTVSLVSYPNTDRATLGPAFLSEFEQGLTKGGVSVRGKSEPVKVNGIPTYEVKSTTLSTKGRKVFLYLYPLLLFGHIYVLTAESFDPLKAEALRAVAKSFRYSTPEQEGNQGE